MGRVDVKCSIDFREILNDIVSERQVKGVDERNKLISFEKVTKAIANMIEANPKIKEALVEVKISGK